MATRTVSCNDATVTFTVNDSTFAVTAVSAVIGASPITVYMLNEDGTVKGSFGFDRSRSINIPIGQRVTETEIIQTRESGLQVSKRIFPHRIAW